jgi:hypothetical protein
MNINRHQVPQPQLLGPAGIQERMRQIQGKLASAGVKGADFDDFVKAPVSELSGAIGGDGTVSPFDPMGSGVRLVPPKAPEEIKGLISKVALETGVDPALLDSLVAAESGYNPMAKSPVGAMGLTQLMRGTAEEMGVTNPFDPVQNLRGGAGYLSKMMKRFGDLPLALAAYNAGPGRVEKAGGVPNIPETKAYVDRVMTLYRSKKGS